MILSLLLFSSSAWASQAPDFTVVMEGGAIVATPPEKYHFNTEAPIELRAGKSALPREEVRIRAKSSELRITASSGEKPASVSAYLCDDAQTFCEKHEVSLEGAFPSAGSSARRAGAVAAPARKLKYDSDGFIDNQPEQALALAAKTSKPLMIDFYGIWCPPCNELSETVFGRPDFKKRMKKFVLLKLDADSDVSWNLKSRYKIGGYPTLVFATPDGDEILRVVGYREKTLLLKTADEAYQSKHQSFAGLQTAAGSGDQTAISRLGQIYFERRDWKNAIRILADSKLKRATYLLALSEQAHDSLPREGAAFEGACLKYLSEFGSSPDSFDVREKLAAYYEESKQSAKRRDLQSEQVSAARELSALPTPLLAQRLAGSDAELADIYEYEAEAHEELAQADEARRAWADAAREYRKKDPSARQRGYNLELAYALWKSGDADAASGIYGKLEARYPQEFTFYYADASFNYARKRYAEALELSRKAYEFAYGDNKLRAALLLAKSLDSSGRKSQAKALVAQVLAQAGVPEDHDIRTHRYLSGLRDFQKTM